MTCHFCQHQVRQRELVYHHTTPRSENGAETVAAHKRCHAKHHSLNGDFQRWGRQGGLVTASRGMNQGRASARPLFR